MAEGLECRWGAEIPDRAAVNAEYDLGLWTAGYEQRSSWLIESSYRPRNVADWYRVEFSDGRDVLSARHALSLGVGELLGGMPGEANHDGHWARVWSKTVRQAYSQKKHRLNVFIDYSSMPRAVYGTILLESCRTLRGKIASLTFAYVPGHHAEDIEGAKAVVGLRSLPGIEGRSEFERSSAVLALGYDGILAEAVVELFQLSHVSCIFGSPGAGNTSDERVRAANKRLLARAELIVTAPGHSVCAAAEEVERLCEWYATTSNVLLVAMGPKPHVLGCILAAMSRPEIGFRYPLTSSAKPIEVSAIDRAVPAFFRVSLDAPSATSRPVWG